MREMIMITSPDLFDTALSSLVRAINDVPTRYKEGPQFYYYTDKNDEKGDYHLEFFLPGVTKENIKIEKTKTHLVLKVTNSEFPNREYPVGYKYRGFQGEFRYNTQPNDEVISAKYENGVLSLHLRNVPPDEEKTGIVIE